ncbi:MAG: hypothetical protein A2Z04_05115 [Chloroflexi bacterium RBG_16_57_9]|nr:MAG: hypothetical protein A2Z04_05115 [Chloroflexi bacterium RBG_16_57_9]
MRVGIIGTSWWVETAHLPGLLAEPRAEVVALCGRNAVRLNALADAHGVPLRFADYREMLDRAQLDVVVVSTPNVTHHPMTLAALDAGAHVICEKPLAMDVAQAREMLERAEAAGRRHMTFFTWRALPSVAWMQKLIHQGYIGTPYFVNAAYFSPLAADPDKPAVWRLLKAQAGSGALGDIGAHMIDMLRWCLGEFRQVIGLMTTRVPRRPALQAEWSDLFTGTDPVPPSPSRAMTDVDADDVCAFVGNLVNGSQVSCQVSFLAHGRDNFQRLEIYGNEGALIHELSEIAPLTGRLLGARRGEQQFNPIPLPPELTAGMDDERVAMAAKYRRLVGPFFEAIEQGGEFAPSFVDGLRVQEVIDAVIRSGERPPTDDR